jgi:hypothetical protein
LTSLSIAAAIGSLISNGISIFGKNRLYFLFQIEFNYNFIFYLFIGKRDISDFSLEHVEDRAILTSLAIAAAIGSLISSGVSIGNQLG